jgi:hypothetical protein
MKDAINHFICRLKEDTMKFIGDIGTVSVAALFSQTENWILIHGAALLIFGRLVLLVMDGYKRLRDVKKPEWESNVKPILKTDALRERKLSTWQKIKNLFKSTL